MSVYYVPQGVPVVSSSFAVSGSHAFTADWYLETASIADHGLNAIGLQGHEYVSRSASTQLVNTGSQGLSLLVVSSGSGASFKMATGSFATDYGSTVGPINGGANNPTLNLIRGNTYSFLIRRFPPSNVDSTFKIINNGTTSYRFIDIGNTGDNLTLNLVRGYRYEFRIDASGYPFWIQTTNPNPSGYDSGNTLGQSDGVYNNGEDVGTIQFLVPHNAPNTLYYVSQTIAGMRGTINITDDGLYGFQIQSTSGQGGTAYNTGVAPSNNIKSGSLIFKVDAGAPSTLYYASPDSPSMNGTINITG